MPKKKGWPRYFLAGVNVEDDDLDVHFLVEDSSGRDGDRISEIVLKSLLPCRCPSRRVKPRMSRSPLRGDQSYGIRTGTRDPDTLLRGSGDRVLAAKRISRTSIFA